MSIGRSRLFFEKTAVAACSLENQAIRFRAIDEKPIRFDVAIAGNSPWPDKGMIPKSVFQGSHRNQNKTDLFKFLGILAWLLELFHIQYCPPVSRCKKT